MSLDTNPESSPDALISQDAAVSYWKSVDPDVNGMLGGFPQISETDIKGSAKFLARLGFKSDLANPPFANCVDCGAGIGRISKGLLCRISRKVDFVEPVSKFSDEIRRGTLFEPERKAGKVGTIYDEGLETWSPDSRRYDLIWNQWCLGHLNDEQLKGYFHRCRAALQLNGLIVVKENMSTDVKGEDIYDEIDSSVTRTDEKFRSIFESVDLQICATEVQRGFPSGLFPVRMYALRPKDDGTAR